jgi:WD40 repeat protein
VGGYDAFISYSHAADDQLAPALQDGLQRFGKRWNRRRALKVFRDDTGLSVNTALWPSIQAALDDSSYFILLASPDASRSEWVNREVARWIGLGRNDRILPVLTDGGWEWDPNIDDFDWNKCSAVPSSLRGAFTEEPRHLDLRWARATIPREKLDLRNSDFRSAIAELAAPIHGLAKDDLEGRDLREFRKARRIRRIATAGLALLTIAVGVAALVAARNSREARRQERVAVAQAELATSRQLAAQSVALAPSKLDLSLLLALTAGRVVDTPGTRGALLSALESNPRLAAYLPALDGLDSAIAASHDGRLAVGDTTGLVRIFDFDDLSVLATTRTPTADPVTSLAFNEKDDLLAIGTDAGDVVLWSLTGAGQTRQLSDIGPPAAVAVLAFDATASQLAVSWSDLSRSGEYIANLLAVWDLSAAPLSIRLGPIEAPIGTGIISFSDRDRLMIFGFFEMQRINLATGLVEETWPLQTGGAQPGPSAHSSGGEVGAWSTLDRGDVSIYRPGPTTGESIADLDIGGGAIDAMKWDHSGSTLAVAKEGSISLWDAEGQELAVMTGAESGIGDFAFAANFDRIASLGNGVVQVWDPDARSRLGTSSPIPRIDVPNVVKRVVDVDFSPHGDLIAWVVDPGGFSRHEDKLVGASHSVAVWNLGTGSIATIDTASTPCVLGFVSNDQLATEEAGCGDGPALEVWDPAGRPLASHTECAPDGVGSWATTRRLYPDTTPSPSESRVCRRGRFRRVDLAETLATSGLAAKTAVAAVATSSSVAAALDSSAKDLVIGRLGEGSRFERTRTVALTNPSGFIGAPVPYVSPDGSTVLVTYVESDPTDSTQGRLVSTVWDVETGKQVGAIGPAAVDDIAFSPRGEVLAVALSHGDIEIRDASTLQVMTVLPGDGDAPARVLEFSPDGRTLAEALSGGGLVIWDLDIEAWAQRACGIAGRDLTSEEVALFVGDLALPGTPCAETTAESSELQAPTLTEATTVVPVTGAR